MVYLNKDDIFLETLVYRGMDQVLMAVEVQLIIMENQGYYIVETKVPGTFVVI